MTGARPPARTPWYETPRFRGIALAILAVVVVAEGVVAIFLRDNDWEGHRQAGLMVRAGGLAAAPFAWYTLGRVVFDVVQSLPPRLVGRAISYLLAIASMWAGYRMWDRMVEPQSPARRPTVFAAAVFTLLATGTLWQRDLDDCGLHLFLLFMLGAAAWHLTHGRRALAGFWLAAAIAHKTSPLLFLPYLAWKREWRTAGWAVLFTLVLQLGPALFYGWQPTLHYHRRTLDTALQSAATRNVSENLLQSGPNPQNQAWPVAVARYVQTHAPGDPLYVDHPWYLQFGHLDDAGTRRVVAIATLVLAALVAWRTWRPCRTSSDWATEWAALSIFPVLLSPVCWKQTLVVMLPAVFLTIRHQLLHPNRARAALVWAIAALVILSAPDGPLGRELALLLGAYKSFTLAALLAAVSVLTLPRVDGTLPLIPDSGDRAHASR